MTHHYDPLAHLKPPFSVWGAHVRDAAGTSILTHHGNDSTAIVPAIVDILNLGVAEQERRNADHAASERRKAGMLYGTADRQHAAKAAHLGGNPPTPGSGLVLTIDLEHERSTIHSAGSVGYLKPTSVTKALEELTIEDVWSIDNQFNATRIVVRDGDKERVLKDRDGLPAGPEEVEEGETPEDRIARINRQLQEHVGVDKLDVSWLTEIATLYVSRPAAAPSVAPLEPTEPSQHGDIVKRLTSGFALLDVTTGRNFLARFVERHAGKGSQSLPPPFRIPIVIRVYIDHIHGGDDGTSREFGIVVENVEPARG